MAKSEPKLTESALMEWLAGAAEQYRAPQDIALEIVRTRAHKAHLADDISVAACTRDIAEAVGCTIGAACGHLRALADKGLARSIGGPKQRRWIPTAEGMGDGEA